MITVYATAKAHKYGFGRHEQWHREMRFDMVERSSKDVRLRRPGPDGSNRGKARLAESHWLEETIHVRDYRLSTSCFFENPDVQSWQNQRVLTLRPIAYIGVDMHRENKALDTIEAIRGRCEGDYYVCMVSPEWSCAVVMSTSACSERLTSAPRGESPACTTQRRQLLRVGLKRISDVCRLWS